MSANYVHRRAGRSTPRISCGPKVVPNTASAPSQRAAAQILSIYRAVIRQSGSDADDVLFECSKLCFDLFG
jgi:hypothetical protein